jgi:hypothetical protein
MEKIKPRTPPIQAIITAGEPVAVKVYRTFFGNEKYTVRNAWEAGRKLAQLKKITRPLYDHLDEVQFLHALATYSEQDILDAFANVKDDICKDAPQSSICSPLARSMAMPNPLSQK